MRYDPAKGRLNFAKHGIAFADVEPVFYDERALRTEQVKQTAEGLEERCLSVGRDALGRVIAVVWTRRDGEIRLISARPASKKERAEYEAD